MFMYRGNVVAKGNVEFTKDDEYYTPKKVLEYFGGNFDYDPATCLRKAQDLEIPNYDTIETDGLTKDWTKYNKIWINPPFTRKFEFIEKAVETFKAKPDICIYILTTTESICTKKFMNAMEGIGFKLYVPSGRINFESGLGKTTKTPFFTTVILKLQKEREIEIIDVNLLKPSKPVKNKSEQLELDILNLL